MSSIKHIAIIGAGIAGLALAIFARKQGIKVTLFEKTTVFLQSVPVLRYGLMRPLCLSS